MRTVPGRTDRIVVVGAGLAGLAAALRLRGAGREVTVVERGPGPGGRAGRVERAGYALDTGPSVFTAPELLADTFAAVGEKLDERLTLLPLETTYRAQFADGSHLDVHADPDRFARGVAELAGPAEADNLRRYLVDLAELYRLQLSTFIDRNLDSPWTCSVPSCSR
ncbi:FAD-dependent oxidoreductase [Blastococcus sp. PRF04-17]|uniref:FAD-dependent oxidoreductase n=1 Tax=Blastococcus sp. PRF04-17 TaxID=2933797 RepID=UPI001FF2CD12|nr:FAD-dependent oxidoreductase [Blastococcus sp. PRF04-17]UOY02954.1 FAD-dependent oxidoreductase [Blastococcus sp. PRF04-17]